MLRMLWIRISWTLISLHIAHSSANKPKAQLTPVVRASFKRHARASNKDTAASPAFGKWLPTPKHAALLEYRVIMLRVVSMREVCLFLLSSCYDAIETTEFVSYLFLAADKCAMLANDGFRVCIIGWVHVDVVR
jgi:hypothetical protein